MCVYVYILKCAVIRIILTMAELLLYLHNFVDHFLKFLSRRTRQNFKLFKHFVLFSLNRQTGLHNFGVHN